MALLVHLKRAYKKIQESFKLCRNEVCLEKSSKFILEYFSRHKTKTFHSVTKTGYVIQTPILEVILQK